MSEFPTNFVVVSLATPFSDGGASSEAWLMPPEYAPAIRALMEKYAVPAGETYAPEAIGSTTFRDDVIDIPAAEAGPDE